MKEVEFLGDSLKNLRNFSEDAKDDIGRALRLLQTGKMPKDYKPMKTIGQGVEEIRTRDANGIYRVIYTARFEDTIYVLHAFQKKTQKTAQADLELAKKRYRQLLGELKNEKN